MNNNNRNNGLAVRAVRQHLPETDSVFRLTRESLMADLRQAYYDARRHKRGNPYVQRFETRLEQNLGELCDELYERRYRPRPS